MKTTWQLIRDSYTEEKKRWDRKYPWLYFGARPISLWITWLIHPLKLSANTITFISFIVGIAACVFLARGYPMGFYVGTILLAAFNIIDCVDGNTARYRKSAGPAGKFYDAIASYPFWLAYLFMGIGLYNTPDSRIDFLLPGFIDKKFFLLVLGIVALLGRLISMDLNKTFDSIIRPAWESLRKKPVEDKPLSGGHSTRWYYNVYLNVTDIQGQDPIIILAAFTHSMSLFLIISALISVLNTLLIVFLYIRRVEKMRRSTQ